MPALFGGHGVDLWHIMIQLFVDKLTNVDFSYLHPTRGLVGETWYVNCEIEGILDAQGMVCDFGIVKKALRAWFDETIDHVLLIPALSPALTTREDGTCIEWRYGEKALHCRSPQQAFTYVNATDISAASVARWCESLLISQFPQLSKLSLELVPENISGVFYHYSHGLKKHNGNCQRIAHGHRSTIQIFRNGSRDESLEQQWAARLQDIYIATREDLVQVHQGQAFFSYKAQQGAFTLDLPEQSCYLLDTDTTVEWIAVHIAEALKQADPASHFIVRAFEGAGKGAIVQR